MAESHTAEKETKRAEERVDGPPKARAHLLLANALEKSKSEIDPRYLQMIDRNHVRELDRVIRNLREAYDYWLEEEWPK